MFAVNMLVHSEQGDTFSFNEIKAGCKKLASKTRVQSKHLDLHHWCSRSSRKSPLPAQMDGFSFIVGNQAPTTSRHSQRDKSPTPSREGGDPKSSIRESHC